MKIKRNDEGKTKLVAIIDGDFIPYKVAYMAHQNSWTLEESMSNLQHYIEKLLILRDFTHYHIFISGKGNFRKQVSAQYKDYRKQYKDDSLYEFFNECKKYMCDNFDAYYVNNAEPDDMCAMMASHYRDQNTDYIVIAEDLDLRQIRGLLINPRTNESLLIDEGFIRIDESKKPKSVVCSGKYVVYFQMISGDKDECPGLKGYGKVKAYNLLKDCKTEDELINVTLNEYRKIYNDNYIEMFKQNFKLVYLLEYNEGMTLPEPKELNYI